MRGGASTTQMFQCACTWKLSYKQEVADDYYNLPSDDLATTESLPKAFLAIVQTSHVASYEIVVIVISLSTPSSKPGWERPFRRVVMPPRSKKVY